MATITREQVKTARIQDCRNRNIKQDLRMMCMMAPCYLDDIYKIQPVISEVYKKCLTSKYVSRETLYDYAVALFWLVHDYNPESIASIRWCMYAYPVEDLVPELYTKLASLLLDEPNLDPKHPVKKRKNIFAKALDKFSRM